MSRSTDFKNIGNKIIKDEMNKTDGYKIEKSKVVIK